MKLERYRLAPISLRIARIALVYWWSLRIICTLTPRRWAAMSAFATGIRSNEYTAIRIVEPRGVWLIVSMTRRSMRNQPFFRRGSLKNGPCGAFHRLRADLVAVADTAGAAAVGAAVAA